MIKDLYGNRNPNWKGGKYKTSGGYILVYKPDHPRHIKGNYVYEHTLVVETKLKRFLLKGERHYRNYLPQYIILFDYESHRHLPFLSSG